MVFFSDRMKIVRLFIFRYFNNRQISENDIDLLSIFLAFLASNNLLNVTAVKELVEDCKL